MTTNAPTMPHAVPARRHQAWTRGCPDCGYRLTSDLLLTVTIRCRLCGRTMLQPPQGTPPDIDTVTEWRACTEDGYRCPDHREDT